VTGYEPLRNYDVFEVARQAGAGKTFMKPFKFEDLIAAVRELTGARLGEPRRAAPVAATLALALDLARLATTIFRSVRRKPRPFPIALKNRPTPTEFVWNGTCRSTSPEEELC